MLLGEKEILKTQFVLPVSAYTSLIFEKYTLKGKYENNHHKA